MRPALIPMLALGIAASADLWYALAPSDFARGAAIGSTGCAIPVTLYLRDRYGLLTAFTVGFIIIAAQMAIMVGIGVLHRSAP